MNERNTIRIFDYFSVKELFTHCANYEIVDCIKYHYIDSVLLLGVVLDSFRDFLGYPIVVTSSYRDIEHNKRVGGVSTSQHLVGQAIDFTCYKIPPKQMIKEFKNFCQSSPLANYLGQVIFYNSFIHIGLRTESHNKLTFYDKRTNKQTN